MTDGRSAYYSSVARTLFLVLLANFSVAVIKILLGLVTGALAVIADGFHSLVDSSSNLIGLASVRLANRPADERHPYGYWRYETIGALAIGVMLLVAAIELSRAILARLVGGTETLAPEPLMIVLYTLTIPINLGIVVYETCAGRRLNSEILLADAAHTRSDLFVSGSVLISLVAATFGYPDLDLVVTAVVVLLILRAAVGILRDTSSWLTDAGFADIAQVEEIAQSVPGVLYVHRVRSRGTPDAGFVDLHIKVYPGMSTSQAHAIASEVEGRLKAQIPHLVDALVHIEPAMLGSPGDWERIHYGLRQIADGMGIGVHDLHVNLKEGGRYLIEVHLEMSGIMSLREAHAMAEAFEARVRLDWPETDQIITHMEPLPEAVLGATDEVDEQLTAEVSRVISSMLQRGELKEAYLSRIAGKGSIAVRVCFPPEYSLEEAHHQAEQIEREVLIRFPDVHRVTVHVEPEDDE